jgi:hypothetical protein
VRSGGDANGRQAGDGGHRAKTLQDTHFIPPLRGFSGARRCRRILLQTCIPIVSGAHAVDPGIKGSEIRATDLGRRIAPSS